MTKIVSIHSFRGGTGKSNLAANLAAQAAMAGKKVAVFDTDIASPGIHVPFGLDEHNVGHTLNEFLNSKCDIGDVAFSIGEHPGDAPGRKKLAGKDLWLAPASIKGEDISAIIRDGYDVGRLNEGIQALRKQYNLDYLFLDTHPGLNEETLLSVAISDVLFLVLRPDQQDFQGTGVVLDIALDLGVPELFLIVNKSLSRYDPRQVAQTVEGRYHQPVAGVLPLSEDMVDLGSADIFSLVYPDHPWSVELRKIASKIM